MNKKGLSTIITSMLIILITLASISILWVAYTKIIKDGNSSDGFDCSLVSVRPEKCVFVTSGVSLPNEPAINENSALGVIRREAGAGEITSVKMIFNFPDGSNVIVDPEEHIGNTLIFDKDFSNFEEFLTKQIINIGDVSSPPSSFNVAAVVGKNTVCKPNFDSVPCKVFT